MWCDTVTITAGSLSVKGQDKVIVSSRLEMSWIVISVFESVRRLAAMGGCLCSKEVVHIDGISYRVKDRIGEG